jgi:hypothetical protein
MHAKLTSTNSILEHMLPSIERNICVCNVQVTKFVMYHYQMFDHCIEPGARVSRYQSMQHCSEDGMG